MSLPAPPREWAVPYRVLAEEVELDPELSVGHRLAAAFLDPVLAADPGLFSWDAQTTEWQRQSP